MNEQDKKQVKEKPGRKKWLLLCGVLLLLGILTAAILYQMRNKGKARPDAEEEKQTSQLEYEGNVITDDAKSLQDAVNELNRKAKEGQMNLQMKTEAISQDGKTFSCYIANSTKNSYDMYIVLYLDDTQTEIYRSGLIPLGGRIETFTLEQTTLEPGEYEATLVYNQIEADRQTQHAHVNVGLTLIVQ